MRSRATVPAVAVICCLCLLFMFIGSTTHTYRVYSFRFISFFFFITFFPFLPNRSRAGERAPLRIYFPFPFFLYIFFFQSLFLSRVSRQTDHVVNLVLLFLCVVAPLPSSSFPVRPLHVTELKRQRQEHFTNSATLEHCSSVVALNCFTLNMEEHG